MASCKGPIRTSQGLVQEYWPMKALAMGLVLTWRGEVVTSSCHGSKNFWTSTSHDPADNENANGRLCQEKVVEI